MTMAEGRGRFQMPIENIEELKPAKIELTFSDLELGDDLWAMFDPNGVLPRDPANLKVDIDSQLKWLKPMSELTGGAPMMAPPVQMENVKITSLDLSLAGAALQAAGEFVIDNTAFPPKPSGTALIDLKGANGLIGKLVQIGIIPQQNALMIQGMSAMLFRPGDAGPDHLISQLEMTKSGTLTANGMPLPFPMGGR
jgi:hypothetical protein